MRSDQISAAIQQLLLPLPAQRVNAPLQIGSQFGALGFHVCNEPILTYKTECETYVPEFEQCEIGLRLSRGWQFGEPTRAIELALAGGGVDTPLAAFKKFMVVTALF